MSAVNLPPPPASTPFLDGAYVSRAWAVWFSAVFNRLGGAADKVDAAHALAHAAAPAISEVVAIGGLQLGGAIGGNVSLALYTAMTGVSALPASAHEGDWAYALNGRKPGEGAGAGTGVPVWWSGGAWVAADSGAAVTA